MFSIFSDTPEIETPPINMNETVVIESKVNDETFSEDKSELILTLANDNTETGNDTEDEEVEDYNSPLTYRPPTPPKMSPKNNSEISPKGIENLSMK